MVPVLVVLALEVLGLEPGLRAALARESDRESREVREMEEFPAQELSANLPQQ